ncbi:ATP-dependent DNA helicase [Thermohalobacter berrensis]|uniref:ATP-dependent DNA helicase n=1 Tax=Thermohalobacter berrensis TaxID=99594 RepID=UPI00242E9303|nr:ATP-dependent DNA helicase [Thermohalobacter berrensis]
MRNLVEFVMRSGDLDTRFMGKSRALEGTKAHQKLQKSSDENYTPEVTVKHQFEYEGFKFTIEGRVDGVIEDVEDIIIDEIKTTTKELKLIDENYNPIHWAQGKCYGYIYATQNNLDKISIQLTYFQLDTEEIKRIKKDYSIEELRQFFYQLLDKYLYWAKFVKGWVNKRNNSILSLEFPFKNYRKGQRKLAVAVYKTIVDEKNLFAQAPTGIGKTISTVFPSVKAMGEGYTSKIFYLTAKTITRQVAEETFCILNDNGLKFKTITLTAKDKICFKEESNCNPEKCEYAKGHFDRVNDAILDILKNENLITREIVERYAKKHRVCPFEFSLDIAIWTDGVICDYNYAFDPRVYLRRFFDEGDGDYIFLVDEAHNLVDRGREMFSAELYKKTFLDVRRKIKDKNKYIAKILSKLNSYMLKLKKKCDNKDYYILDDEPEGIYGYLRQLITESEDWLAKNQDVDGYEELLQLYFDAHAFLRIAEFYDERYVAYVEKVNKDFKLKLFCHDPSYLLGEAVKRGNSAIFFSATLTPIKYFRDVLGGKEDDHIMRLPSPFDRKNLCLMIASNISTRYKDRENSYLNIAEYINEVVKGKSGNYMVFFPSYKYMTSVIEIFKERYPNFSLIEQAPSMTEEEREEFLRQFKPDYKETLVGFAVLGGIFSEGIDLKGERLSGAIIVGVGLPQLCLERDIIRDYFNDVNGKGFQYSYMYPGMNKVLQGAGRVIRSEKDKGVVLLIDDRFCYSSYERLFPREWFPYIGIKNKKDIPYYLNKFWNR